MKEKALKQYIREFRDKYLLEENHEALFTEPVHLTFCNEAIKNGWITSSEKIEKSYLMRMMVKTLREDVEPENRGFIQLIACSGTTRIDFTEKLGYSNKVLTGFRWKDQSLSPYCYDTIDILGEYKKTGSLIIKRKSQYLHPEYPFEDAFTKAGRIDLIKRLKSLNYDMENINHNRNVIHLLAAVVDAVELLDNKIDKVIEHQTQLGEKLDKILNILSENPKKG